MKPSTESLPKNYFPSTDLPNPFLKKGATKKMKILIPLNGPVTFIYNDLLAGLLKTGEATIERVSNVEPTTSGQWEARMKDGPILGPFTLRSEALTAEVAYLEEQLFHKGGK